MLPLLYIMEGWLDGMCSDTHLMDENLLGMDSLRPAFDHVAWIKPLSTTGTRG